MRTALFCTLAIGLLVGAATPTHADIITTALPDLERLYGGFVGDTFQSTTFDFGTEFVSVDAVSLQLAGFTDVASSTLTFAVSIEEVETPPFGLLVEQTTFDVDIPLLFGVGVLDGVGELTLNLDTTGPGLDLSSTVTTATLTFDGVPVPEPGTAVLLGLGILALSWGRRPETG